MKNSQFVVYARDTGGMYLALRKARKSVTARKYTWCKSKSRAVKLTAESARRLASTYRGTIKSV